MRIAQGIKLSDVSTHSRAEAAANLFNLLRLVLLCFNTQPRGGGCLMESLIKAINLLFQHTAARRRLLPT